MARPVGTCPKCMEEKPMTRHHVFPVRFYGRKDNEVYFYLCRECHTELEKIIPLEQVEKYLYPLFIIQFLAGGNMNEELICLKCGEPVDPEAAIVINDIMGTWYFHKYCMEEDDDSTVRVQPTR